ncbi:MAG: hypothetical protein ACRDZ4_10030 [Egibacteraceae bacterium]
MEAVERLLRAELDREGVATVARMAAALEAGLIVPLIAEALVGADES